MGKKNYCEKISKNCCECLYLLQLFPAGRKKQPKLKTAGCIEIDRKKKLAHETPANGYFFHVFRLFVMNVCGVVCVLCSTFTAVCVCECLPICKVLLLNKTKQISIDEQQIKYNMNLFDSWSSAVAYYFSTYIFKICKVPMAGLSTIFLLL